MKILLSLALICMLNLLACTQEDFTAVNNSSTRGNALNIPPSPSVYSCLANMVDLQIMTSIDSFQLTGGVGLGSGGLFSAIGVNASYSSGELDMSMKAFTPIYGNGTVASASGIGTTNNFSVSVSGLAGIVAGNISAWQSTSLSNVSNAALNNAFQNLLVQLQNKTPTWFRIITQIIDPTDFLIPIGSTASVQVGDTFYAYKANYIWQSKGAPCASPLSVPIKSATPYATLTVKEVSEFSSIVSVDPNVTTPVEVNDLIEVAKLTPTANGTPRTVLGLSVALNPVTQASGLQFSNGTVTQTVDMTPFVQSDFQTIIEASTNFYLAP